MSASGEVDASGKLNVLGGGARGSDRRPVDHTGSSVRQFDPASVGLRGVSASSALSGIPGAHPVASAGTHARRAGSMTSSLGAPRVLGAAGRRPSARRSAGGSAASPPRRAPRSRRVPSPGARTRTTTTREPPRRSWTARTTSSRSSARRRWTRRARSGEREVHALPAPCRPGHLRPGGGVLPPKAAWDAALDGRRADPTATPSIFGAVDRAVAGDALDASRVRRQRRLVSAGARIESGPGTTPPLPPGRLRVRRGGPSP